MSIFSHSPPLFTINTLTAGVFWASYICWIGLELYLLIRDAAKIEGETRDSGSRRLVIACVAMGISLAFCAPWFLGFAKIVGAGPKLFAVSMIVFWLGMALRLWAVTTLGRFFRTAVHIAPDHLMVTAGPYRWLRHPSYSGGLLIMIGVGLAMGNWISLIAAIVMPLIGYLRRIAVEERALRETFGLAFEIQRSKSWALAPFFW